MSTPTDLTAQLHHNAMNALDMFAGIPTTPVQRAFILEASELELELLDARLNARIEPLR